MENVKKIFFQKSFLQRDNQGFLKDVQVRLTNKSQASDPLKKVFTG